MMRSYSLGRPLDTRWASLDNSSVSKSICQFQISSSVDTVGQNSLMNVEKFLRASSAYTGVGWDNSDSICLRGIDSSLYIRFWRVT